MNYPHQRAYWTRRRVWLLVVLAVLALIGGTNPQGLPDLLGLTVGLVLFTSVLVALYHGVGRIKSRVDFL